MLRLLAIVCVISAVVPARAANDDEDPRVAPQPAARTREDPTTPAVESSPPRRTAVYAVMGLGAPLGLGGFEGVHRFGSTLEVSGGFGRGLGAMSSRVHPSVVHDLQWALMPRLRAGNNRHAFTFGAGISGGNYGSGGGWFCEDVPCPVRDYDYPTRYFIWGNAEIGTEHWFGSGFALRTFVGYALGCAAESCASDGESFPYTGLGLGYAF